MWRSPRTNAVNSLLCLIWLGYINMSTSVSSCCRKRNIMSWTGNIRCYFFLFAKLPMVETNSENYSHTSRFRSIKLVFIMLFFILLHCMLHFPIFCDQGELSDVRPYSTVPLVPDLFIYPTDWLWKGKFPEQRNFVFLTQINSWEYTSKGNCRVHSVCFQPWQLQINPSIDRPLLLTENFWGTGEYLVTIWSIPCTRNHWMFCKRTKLFVFLFVFLIMCNFLLRS